MVWPNLNQYAEAVQNPRSAFADPDLQAGRVTLNNLQLPKAIAGNFATVFTIEGRGQKWAIRCFQHEVTDQQQRYAAITAHLQGKALDFMVGFEYIPQGIRVSGKWYPIIKMDWTQGATLEQFIETHLGAKDTLLNLANRWAVICRSLRQADMAHGDLQHGNILVTGADDLKLIDYDGMVIPSVIHLPPHEIGHRHYQHPTRTAQSRFTLADFRNIDNFPAQVIGNSLHALAIDPTLWERTKAGGENLIFRESDYKVPNQSKTLALLKQHPDGRIRSIAGQIDEAIAARSFLEVEPYEHLAGKPPASVFGWLNDHVKQAVASAVQAPSPSPFSPPATRPTAPSWLRDALTARTSDQVDYPDAFVEAEREYLAATFPFGRWRVLRVIFRLFAERQIAERFPRYPLAIEKSKIQRKLERQFAFREQLKKRMDETPETLDDPRLSANPRVIEAERKLRELTAALQQTGAQEGTEIAALERLINQRLMRFRITANTIPGIGPARIAALNAAGVHTAADIVPANFAAAAAMIEQVRNAVPQRDWEILKAWRDDHINNLHWDRSQYTTGRTPEEIHARFERRRQDLQKRIQEEQSASTMVRILVLKEEKMRRASLKSQLAEAEVQIRETERELLRYKFITPEHLLDKVLEDPGAP